MKAIMTKFVPGTDTKGARIKATAGKACTITLPYPHELNADDAHHAAAVALCNKMNWPGKLIQGGLETGECVFVFEPRSVGAVVAALENLLKLAPVSIPCTATHDGLVLADALAAARAAVADYKNR